MVPMDDSPLHRIELVSSIQVLKRILDYMEDVATRYISCCIFLAYNGILAAAKVVALQTSSNMPCMLGSIPRHILICRHGSKH